MDQTSKSIRFFNGTRDLLSSLPLAKCYYGLTFVLALIFIWASSVVPFQDLPSWTYEGVIFKEILFNEEFARSFEIFPFPVPNSVTVFFIGIFHVLFSYVAAQKMMLSLYAMLFLFASYYFFFVFTRESTRWLMFLAPLYLFNNSMFWGNISNNFGNSFFLIFVAYVYETFYKKRELSFFLIAILSMALFFSHGLTVLAVVPFIGFFLLSHPPAKIRNALFLSLFIISCLSLFFIFNAPSSGELSWSNRSDTITFSLIQRFIRGMGSFVIPLSFVCGDISHPLPFLSEFIVVFNYLALSGLGFFIGRLVVLKVLKGDVRWGQENGAMPLLATMGLFFLYIVLLPDCFMGIFGAGRRFAILWLFLLCAWIGKSEKPVGSSPVLFFVGCLITLCFQFLLNLGYWRPYDIRSKEIANLNSYQPKLHKWYNAFSIDSRCHIEDYEAIERHEVRNCFETSLIRRKRE